MLASGSELSSSIIILRPNIVPYLLAAVMAMASAGAMLERPTTMVSDLGPAVSLENMIPKYFGEWREDSQAGLQLVNPQVREILDKLYNQVLSRVYVNAGGYRVMLSIAYGKDQRGSLQAHRPEVCYPAQGFALEMSRDGLLSTSFGQIRVRRLFASMGARKEPLPYLFLVGDSMTHGRWDPRLGTLRYGLVGKMPDGFLFRVSSIDA